MNYRHSIRLKSHDYSKRAAYFITICCHERISHFGNILKHTSPDSNNTALELTPYGKIASLEWKKLPDRFANVDLDEFVIMPNHMHGIILLSGGASDKPSDSQPNPVSRGLSEIIGSYKSLVACSCLELHLQKTNSFDQRKENVSLGKIWQRGFYEHVIRNHFEYLNISDYIANNPANWLNDKLRR